MDDHHGSSEVAGPWAGGWLIAGGAGLFAMAVAKLLGDVGPAATGFIGGLTFLVHGALLGSGGVEMTAGDGPEGDDHGHN
jgi:hypothetical protein